MQHDGKRIRAGAVCEVRLGEGVLLGRLEDGIRVFKGIPYARAPIGPLRFLPPQPAQQWFGTLEASSFAPAAPQPRDLGRYAGDPDAMPAVSTSEDCLYLNVWAPTNEGLHPVLVWFHGGSQILGGTARPVYNGAVFARAGIVSVTVGFRLGALGYLELGELLGPRYRESGNNGLADQLAALRWVKKNIAAFGGDDQRITLAGESAGAKNIAALLASPQAATLFQAAFLQSGGGETVHDLNAAREIALRFLTLAGGEAPDLLTLPVERLLSAQEQLLLVERRFPFRPMFGTAMLPEPPLSRIGKAKCTRRPLIVGTTRDEIGPMLADSALEGGWRVQLLAHRSPAEMAEIETRFATAFPSLASSERRRQLTNAEEYWIPAIKLADANDSAGAPTWAYRFDLPLAGGPLAGAVPHTLDLGPAWEPSTKLHEILAKFVRTHRADWPRYDALRRSTALIRDTFDVIENPARVLIELFERERPAIVPRGVV